MSGETEQSPSAFTTDSLHLHVIGLMEANDRRLSEMMEANDRRYTERFDAQEAFSVAALVAAKEALNAALVAAKEAVDKAERESIKWQAGANEWRGAMNDRERTFVPRVEYEQRHTALAEVQRDQTSRVDDSLKRLHERMDTLLGERNGSNATKNNIYALLGALAASVGIVSALILALK